MNTTTDWLESNQTMLTGQLARIRGLLEARLNHAAPSEAAESDLPAGLPLERLCAVFGLSPFERDVILLCAGVELDADLAALCSQLQNGRSQPSFSLALSALPGAHWSALSPVGPLRRWRLVDVGSESLTQLPLRLDERILHYLTGISYLDERLQALIESIPPAAASDLSGQAAQAWTDANGAAVIFLCGERTSMQNAVAAAACGQLGLTLFRLSAQSLPADAHERQALARLWERETALENVALLLDCHGENGYAASWIASLQCGLFVAASEATPLPSRTVIRLEIPRPATDDQRRFWQNALGEQANALNGTLDRLAATFDLSPAQVSAVVQAASIPGEPIETLPHRLWQASRRQARLGLEALAQRIETAADWNDLVLPDPQRQTLAEIAVHVRQRTRVYETWGMAAKSKRGLGISALFAGPSGTGKTLAAEVLANELELDLYRIDLASVVSKYIGETEKNLRQVFDAAEVSGAILLFDEADALFGKRSEVKDSHDRYANVEISYLLQRMEAYRGLAILTTNMKSSLDPAFLRRLRFVVNFPFPEAAQRAEIWRRMFPAQTPTRELDMERLARLNVAGGNIRNIALNAAFLAAESDQPVQMIHLLRAARGEYAKLEKPLNEAEIAGWSKVIG